MASLLSVQGMEAVAVARGTFWHLEADDCRVGGLARSYSDSDLLGACVASDDEHVSECGSVHELCGGDSADESTTCGETRWSESCPEDDEVSPLSNGAEQHSFPEGYFWVQAVPMLQSAVEQAAVSEGSKKRRRRGGRGRRAILDGESEVQELTTMMVKNIPNNLTRAALLELFDAAGFQGLYDFVYLPIDFDSDVNLGYCFVNMADGDAGQEFWKAFDGFCEWGGDRASNKVCRLEWSQVQGLDAHVQRYRNSPLLHASSPDERRPILLHEGVRVEFPPPTCTVKAPRRKGRH